MRSFKVNACCLPKNDNFELIVTIDLKHIRQVNKKIAMKIHIFIRTAHKFRS
jgi:hypothetical protein